jgi:hypothetical protein
MQCDTLVLPTMASSALSPFAYYIPIGISGWKRLLETSSVGGEGLHLIAPHVHHAIANTGTSATLCSFSRSLS